MEKKGLEINDEMSLASSPESQKALNFLWELQDFFRSGLDDAFEVQSKYGSDYSLFETILWMRNNGKNGGGARKSAIASAELNRASINVSHIHYDESSKNSLSSASALSTIIHPKSPHFPSMHMHISWTELRDGQKAWRIMADLNPSLYNDQYKEWFLSTFKEAGGAQYQTAIQYGDEYFYIPILDRTRGVAHFYLEAYNTGNFSQDLNFAKNFGQSVVRTYCKIMADALKQNLPVTDQQRSVQIDYHTLYMLQVLTLDKGTTTGLLVHDQNDSGTMASIPSHINVELLKSWIAKAAHPQNLLIEALASELGNEKICLVDETIKKKLADQIRHHYQKFPETLKMQAKQPFAFR